MPLDHYVTLGRSGLRVSPLCLGAMTFGEDLGWGSSVEESQQIIDRYVELGGNFIDTANFYTKSHSEKIIGDHIGRHPARRDRLVIATKFSGNLYPGDPNGGGSGRKIIDQRLRELAAPPADRLHRPVLAAHLGHATRRSRRRWRRSTTSCAAGKVRYLGVSDTPAWKIAEANLTARFRGWSPFIGLQIEYSLLERTVEQELVPMAREFGLGITPWSPLEERRAQRQVHAKQRRPDTRPIAARWWKRSSTRRPTRSSTNSRPSPKRTRPPSPASRWPGCMRSRA